MQVGDISTARQAQQKLCETSSPGSGGRWIVGERTVEEQIATRGSGLKYGEPLAADFPSKLEGVLVMDPGQIIRVAVGVLNLQGGQIGRIADRIDVPKVEFRHAAVDGGKGDAGNSQFAGNVLVEIELKAPRMDAVISEAELVRQLGSEQMGFAQSRAAVGLDLRRRLKSRHHCRRSPGRRQE